MRRNVVVAIKFEIVEGCGDSEPARHGGRFDAGDAGVADNDHVTAAHGPADQNDFEFDESLRIEFARAQEKKRRWS